ncbi:hypothetical protein Trichorick_00188 [Candidatus Trichorickettsia mobilis]|uniref:Uncharacterized protein n=1 Tax=Candidatus Trichorickettsia mobilis TaxID=1346319 RepID=A0ABZ0URS9_9RICK|nr:hypothetical protein Trichorick_00188 [Candidatus Trichorickettsia mobilis]
MQYTNSWLGASFQAIYINFVKQLDFDRIFRKNTNTKSTF